MPTNIFAPGTGGTNSGNAGTFSRVQCTPLLAASLGQVRVTFVAGGAGWKTLHCSIGVVGAATPPNTQATPTELLFSGAHGFNLGAGASIVSDWVNFSCLSSDQLMVIFDDDSGANGDGGSAVFNTGLTGCNWYLGGAASYNQATVTGFSPLSSGFVYGFNLIETQAGGGGTRTPTLTLMGVG